MNSMFKFARWILLVAALAAFRQAELIHVYDNEPLTDFAFTPNGQYLLTVGQSTKLWDWPSRKVLKETKEVLENGRVVVFPHGKQVAIAVKAAIEYRTLPALETTTTREVTGAPTALALSSDAKLLAYAACLDEVTINRQPFCTRSEVNLIDAQSTKPLHKWDAGFDKIIALAFTRDGKRLLAGICASQRKTDYGTSCTVGRVVAWDTATFEETSRSPALSNVVFGMALTPDERTLAVAVRDGTMTAFSHPDLKALDAKFPESQAVGRVLFSADGKTLFGSSRDRIRAWDIATGTLISKVGALRITTLRLTPDAKQIVAGNDDGDLFLFDFSDPPPAS